MYENDTKFSLDETVDIVNYKKKESYEGKIICIKESLIYVKNFHNNKEELYHKSQNNILKLWKKNKPFRLYNRIDLQLPNTDYWVEATIIEIDFFNNKIYVQYRNKNRFKRIVKEWIDFDSDRIAEPGSLTYNDNKLDGRSIDSNEGINVNHILINEAQNESADLTLLLNKAQEYAFELIMNKKNFRIKKIIGDGNCLFRAISDQVYGTEDNHQIIREKCVEFIILKKNFFKDFIDGDFDEYVEEKKHLGEWGDDVEIEALSEIYFRPIEIYSGTTEPLKCFHEKKIKGKEPIRISYHGSKHYNSVIPTNEESYEKYIKNIIDTEPGIYEDNIINRVKKEEEELKEGTKLSIEENNKIKTKKLQSMNKEEILGKSIFNLNKTIKIEPSKEEKLKMIKESKNEDDENDKEVNDELKNASLEDKKKTNQNKTYFFIQKKRKSNDDFLCPLENKLSKSKEEKINQKKEEGNKIEEEKEEEYCDAVKFALEIGYDIDKIAEAYSIVGDNKEQMLNYLISNQ